MGYLPAYEKKGYAFEAAHKIVAVAQSEFKIKKISAITIETNKASQRLIEKQGLTYRETITLPNDDESLLLYTL